MPGPIATTVIGFSQVRKPSLSAAATAIEPEVVSCKGSVINSAAKLLDRVQHA